MWRMGCVLCKFGVYVGRIMLGGFDFVGVFMWLYYVFLVGLLVVFVLIVCGGCVVDSMLFCEFFDFGDIYLCSVFGDVVYVCEVVWCMLLS